MPFPKQKEKGQPNRQSCCTALQDPENRPPIGIKRRRGKNIGSLEKPAGSHMEIIGGGMNPTVAKKTRDFMQGKTAINQTSGKVMPHSMPSDAGIQTRSLNSPGQNLT
jgi:hypothetical protein